MDLASEANLNLSQPNRSVDDALPCSCVRLYPRLWYAYPRNSYSRSQESVYHRIGEVHLGDRSRVKLPEKRVRRPLQNRLPFKHFFSSFGRHRLLTAAVISIRNPHQGFKFNLPTAAPLVTNSQRSFAEWDHAARRRASAPAGQARAYYSVWARKPLIRCADPRLVCINQDTATF